jgi:hypothetical protein
MASSQTTVKQQQDPLSSRPLTLEIGNNVSVRVYWNSCPNYLEIAPLQKGLVLLVDDEELIEEGAGFGVPVVKYLRRTYFSSSAESWVEQKGNHYAIVKFYALDAIARKRLGKASYINDDFYRFFHKFFEKAYLSNKKWAFIFNKIMEFRRTVGVQTEFVKVKTKGRIKVKYTFESSIIRIHVDLADLDRAECREILILNEQGSTFFRKYSDTTGLRLLDEKIGAWEIVRAEEASLSNIRETLKFTLLKQEGNLLFRGWEKTSGRFAWTGLGYSLKRNASSFEYIIRLGGLRKISSGSEWS